MPLGSVFEPALSSTEMSLQQNPFAVGVAEVYAQHQGPLHWHDSYEIGYVLSGSGRLAIEGQSFLLQPQGIHVIQAGYRHMAYSQGGLRLLNIHFHPQLLQDAFAHLEETAKAPFAHFQPVLNGQHSETAQLRAVLEGIYHEQQNGASGWLLVAKGLLLQATGLLFRHFQTQERWPLQAQHRRESLSRMAPALRLIESNLLHPPTLATLAASVNLSPSQFGLRFKEVTGFSPVAYRNARRLDLAQRLLNQPSLSVAEIAHRVGFASVQQFNRLFLRQYGQTPGHYRQTVKSVQLSHQSTLELRASGA